jgi:hypothetical protein
MNGGASDGKRRYANSPDCNRACSTAGRIPVLMQKRIFTDDAGDTKHTTCGGEVWQSSCTLPVH